MDSWRKTFREGIAPLLSDAALAALRAALCQNDRTLIQKATTEPAPILQEFDSPVQCGCALAYCGWRGEGLESVGAVTDYFGELCYAADRRLGGPAAVRWFINWFDDTPRGEMIWELVEEVQLEIDRRLAAHRATEEERRAA